MYQYDRYDYVPYGQRRLDDNLVRQPLGLHLFVSDDQVCLHFHHSTGM